MNVFSQANPKDEQSKFHDRGLQRAALILLSSLVAMLILCVIILSTVPPVARDELIHHLAVPKLYIKHGGMIELPFMPFSYYPMNLDLLYLFPLYFGNDVIPKYIHFSFALATAWLILVYLKRKLNLLYGLLGALFFLSTPVIIALSTTAYIDLGIIFFSSASLLFLLRWIENGFRIKTLVLAAIFCGLALGTKYNGLIVLLLLTFFAAFAYSRYVYGKRFKFLRSLGQGLVFFVVALLAFSPWMIRNYHWTNNPLYPFYDNWFNPPKSLIEQAAEDGSDRKEASAGHNLFSYRKVIYGEEWWQMALLPLRIFFEGKDGDPKRFDGKLNPLLLLFPLFALYRSKEDSLTMRREKGILIAFTALYFAFAFFSKDLRMRYIAPIIPPLVILSVLGFRNLIDRAGRLSSKTAPWGRVILILGLISLLSLNFSYGVSHFTYVDPFSYLGGKVTRHEYIARFIPEYRVVQYLNQRLPEDALVSLIFLGNRGYYLERDYVYGEDLIYRIMKEADKPEDILEGLRAAKVTHLLIQERIFGKWLDINFNEAEKSRLHDFFRSQTKGVFQEDGFSVFSLKEVIS